MEEGSQTILFVDDEKGVLSSLRRLFIDEDWDMHFALSAAEGLEILKEESIDLVVSDVRMPEMDGIAFLSKVKTLYPETVRIFLSGYADHKAILKAFADGCAQQLLPKPWDDQEIRNVIKEALELAENQKKKIKGFQKIINSLSSLPPMPSTYVEFKKHFTDPDNFSFDKIADIIEKDVSISAKLIRWANSAMFGQRNKVESVKRAVLVLGSSIAEGLVLAESLLDSMPAPESSSLWDRQEFQYHAIACGVIAKSLMAELNAGDTEAHDRAFTAGLLHDIGKLVEESHLHEQFIKIVKNAKDKHTLIYESEQEVLGTTHEEIGSYLAEWWNMPTFLVNAIRWHHTPELCKIDCDLIATVHIADVLAQQFLIGESGNFSSPKANQQCWEKFNLSEERLANLKEEVIKNMPI